MAFKLSKEQLANRAALTADLRDKARALNIAIAEFNRGVGPFAQAVAEAQDAYNETLDVARNLADGIAEPAREQFDAKSERWQEGENGMRVRSWIEQWEMSLDDIELSYAGTVWKKSTRKNMPYKSRTHQEARWSWSMGTSSDVMFGVA